MLFSSHRRRGLLMEREIEQPLDRGRPARKSIFESEIVDPLQQRSRNDEVQHAWHLYWLGHGKPI